MDIVEQIKTNMFSAMRTKCEVEKTVLQTVLGEISSIQGKTGVAPPKDVVEGIIRKMIASNNEVIQGSTNAPRNTRLTEENEILNDYLPPRLTIEEIYNRLPKEVLEMITNGENKGKIMGKAMKALKSPDYFVDGKDVEEAIKRVM